MLALTATADGSGSLSLQEVQDPTTRPDEALVAVRAVSLNRGEVMNLRAREPGTIPGWDIAGVVTTEAEDGSGPPAGARVVGLMPFSGGSWAQLATVPTAMLAVLPDGVGFEAASALPVAGLTALGSLSLLDLLLGRRVAISGASGGVGRLALQLARLAGAHVTAVVSSASRADGLTELGAHEVRVGFEDEGESFDLILESVGGRTLASAARRLAKEGVIACYGNSSRQPSVIDLGEFHTRSAGASIYGFMVFEEVQRTRLKARDLSRLGALVDTGALDPQVEVVASWRMPDAVLDALVNRRVAGKAVLVVD